MRIPSTTLSSAPGPRAACSPICLTASGRHRVLLLEAGGHDRNIWIYVPLGYGKLFTNPKVNWLYTSEPEAELNNRRIIQPRGKVLGGSSSINGLLYIRGQPADFDHWRQLGNSGWSFDDVLPQLRRAEDQQRGEDAMDGAGGPLAVSDVCEPHPSREAFIAAAQQAGFPRNDDFNGHPPRKAPATSNLRRVAAVGARLPSAICARRVAGPISPSSRMHWRAVSSFRDVVPSVSNTATPIRHGSLMQTRKSSLPAAHSNSPQLLQLSGLGPAPLLQSLGISVIADMLGVGADLQDHLQVRMQYRCTERITMNDVIHSWRHRAGAGLRYALFKKGLLAIGAGYAGGFFRTSQLAATPDVQVHFIIFSARRPAPPCTHSRASLRRFCPVADRRAAASCASSRPTRANRQRSSRAICPAQSTATPSSRE